MNAFGQSPAASGDLFGTPSFGLIDNSGGGGIAASAGNAGGSNVGNQLASAALNIGQAFGIAAAQKQAAGSVGRAVKSNSGTILLVAGIGAVVVVGGIIGLVLLTRK